MGVSGVIDMVSGKLTKCHIIPRRTSAWRIECAVFALEWHDRFEYPPRAHVRTAATASSRSFRRPTGGRHRFYRACSSAPCHQLTHLQLFLNDPRPHFRPQPHSRLSPPHEARAHIKDGAPHPPAALRLLQEALRRFGAQPARRRSTAPAAPAATMRHEPPRPLTRSRAPARGPWHCPGMPCNSWEHLCPLTVPLTRGAGIAARRPHERANESVQYSRYFPVGTIFLQSLFCFIYIISILISMRNIAV